jgi:hypothetical protein
MTAHFVLRRHKYSNDRTHYADSTEAGRVELDKLLGGQAEWFWSVPGVFRALAAPTAGEHVAAAPNQTDPHEQTLGYWSALHYLLLYRLGWSKPDGGLRWWYDHGKPVDDPTLALISAVWDSDGHLDEYLAWLLKGRPTFLNPENVGSAEWPHQPVPLSETWRRWAAEAKRAEDIHSSLQSFGGGLDPMHLTGHSGESGRPDSSASLTITSRAERQALFLTTTMDAWYFDLAERAKSLPNVGNLSWRVDVLVKPVGFLGTYRKSRDTGLWFAGQHRYHTPGN